MITKKIERCKRAIDRHRINLALRLQLGDKDKAEKANTALVNTIANLRAVGVSV